MTCFKPIWPFVWRSTYEEALETIDSLERELQKARKNDYRDERGRYRPRP
jgi:hypothetical protein